MGQDPSQIREGIEQTRSEMGETVDALAHKGDVKGRVKESIAGKCDRFANQMRGAGSRLNSATPDAGEIGQGARQAVGIAEENPLGLMLGGLAVGFLAGMMIPSTRVEDERVGPLADQVKERAAEAGQEAVERGKQVAGEAVETAKESGREQAEGLKESVRQ